MTGPVTIVLACSFAIAAPPQVERAPGRPFVHIEVRGPAAVELRRQAEGDAPATTVCAAPCDRVVDGAQGDAFVLDGPRMSPSLSFLLADQPEAIDIVVRPGFRPLTILGWTLIGIGAAAVVGGAVTLTLADDDRSLRRAGGFTLLGGLPVLIGGGVMAAFGRTRYRFADPADGSTD